jgi:hypothetical protein
MILSRIVQREQGDYEKDQGRRKANVFRTGRRTLETLMHTRAAITLQLSPTHEFERAHHAGVMCMEIERIEGK